MSIEYYNPLNTSYIDNIEQDGDVALKATKAIFKVRLNGICEIEITIPYDKEKRWELIQKGGVIKAPTPYSDGQLFAISNLKRGMLGLEIKAPHIFFDLIRSTTDDIRAENKTCQQALDILLSGTIYKGHSNITKLATCYFIEKNRVAFINGTDDNTIIKRWGGELFLNNYDIYINDVIGGDYGVEISYGKNLIDIGLNESYNEIVTRGKPKAFNGRRLPELYIDSPLVNNYRIIYEDFIDMSDLKLKEDTQDGEGFDTEKELHEAMRSRMKELYDKGLDKPVVTGNIKVVALENTDKYKHVKGLVNVGLGDVVHINHKNIGADIQARCIGYDWNILTRKYEDIVIGDTIKNYFEKQSNVASRIDNILNTVVDDNGDVVAEKVKGFLDATKTKLKAQRQIGQLQDVRAFIWEDLDPNSPNYGCMIGGSAGIQISQQRTPDGRDWDFTSAFTAEGIIADKIVGNLFSSKDGSTTINMNNGEFRSKQPDGSEVIISPQDGFYNKFGLSKREYHHLSYQTRVRIPPQSGSGYGYTSVTVQLPDEFKGKKFEAFVSLGDMLSATVPSTLAVISDMSATCGANDYINATVRVDAMLGMYDVINNSFHSQNENLEVTLTVMA